VEFLERNICGADLHCWRDGWIGEAVVRGGNGVGSRGSRTDRTDHCKYTIAAKEIVDVYPW